MKLVITVRTLQCASLCSYSFCHLIVQVMEPYIGHIYVNIPELHAYKFDELNIGMIRKVHMHIHAITS